MIANPTSSQQQRQAIPPRLASAWPLRRRCLAVQPLLGLERVHRGLARHRRRIIRRHASIHGLLLHGHGRGHLLHLLVRVHVLRLLHPVVCGILSGNRGRWLHHHLASAVARSKGIHRSRHTATVRGMHGHGHCLLLLLLLLLRVAATRMHWITRLRRGESVRRELRLSVALVSMHLLRA